MPFPLAPGLRFGLKKSEEVDDSISSALGQMRQEAFLCAPISHLQLGISLYRQGRIHH